MIRHPNRPHHPTPPPPAGTARPGFTLVELLVVISITSLLIAILLPSLGHARQNARSAACLSNLHQLANAFQAYLVSHNEYPVWAPKNDRGQYGVCSWAFGGKTTAIDPWRTWLKGRFYIKANDRPLNPMLGYARPAEPVPITDDHQRADLPVYRCPSDDGSWQAKWGSGTKVQRSAYDDVGTSYQMNFHWYGQKEISRLSTPERLAWGRQLFNKRANHGAARFILLMDDPLDYSIFDRIETMGFHNKWARHNVLMLDGHAEPLYVSIDDLDRAPFPYGPLWTVYDEDVTELTTLSP